MHLSDGILPAPVLAAGFVMAGGLTAWGARGLRDEEIPRIAVFTATFFCASLLHFKVPPTSVHLLFHGLLGVVLGRRALLAIPIGLALQAALLGHGGISTLGVNASMFGLAALLAHQVFRQSGRAVWLRPFMRGALAAASAVVASAVMLMGLLWWAGEGFRLVAQYALLAHLPVLAIESMVTGFTVDFLRRVQPALLAGGLP
ncbi:MAG TPA: CbiM family transporter [Candidatus Paceibacterota bacterium]|nr:CbiM family transporter [Verrucomicrobiota bacterium]HRY50432.1 CbiM family transporter [Candidatus Paceibacterota bacterium]HSA01520.1 CbiM family transporter [Candidatus Paceibacterota bacterium]